MKPSKILSTALARLWSALSGNSKPEPRPAAERNVAVSATPFGEAWHEVNAHANEARNFTRRELDALLDGDMAEAPSYRRCSDVAANAIQARMHAFEGELERFASEN